MPAFSILNSPDDTETRCYAWAIFGDRADPPAYNTPEGPELIEQGEPFDRPYAEKQRFPADAEATEGMGPITEHEKENLVPSDKGVVLYRKRLREIIRALQQGQEPRHACQVWPAGPIPTYGGDTVLTLPKNGGDDGALLRKAGQAVMQAQFAAEGLAEPERLAKVIAALKALEAKGLVPPIIGG